MNIAKKLVTNDALTIQWADGTTTTIKYDDHSSDIRKRAMQHGFSQKLGDSYSGASSVTEAKLMFADVALALMENDWNRKGGSSGGVWVEAMAQAAEDTFANALEAWNNMDDDAKKEIRKDSRVKQAKLEIDLANAKKKADNAPKFTL